MADFVIVGGGVIGLALADALLQRHPDSRVIVLEKENAVAEHSSGRNSGVLHAGFYYAPDSLKARLTRLGNVMLREFCEQEQIAVRDTGKVVVATSPQDLGALDTLLERGRANGVPVESITADLLAELEPLARTYERALWSPTTAVASPVAVVQGLAERVRRRGGTVRLGAEVVSAVPGEVTLASGETLSAGHIVNAAGLYALRIAELFGVGGEYVMLPFKGLYWYGNWKPGRLQRHVYPVPDPRNPFLGVHLTVTVDGRVKIGPTAIPVLSHENYRGLKGLSPRELLAIMRTYPAFAISPHHRAWDLVRTELPKLHRATLVRGAQALVPSVDPRDFTERGRPGIRAQLFDRQSKRLEMDFVVRPGERSTHVLNAVSPAWTSSLAVAGHVVDHMVL